MISSQFGLVRPVLGYHAAIFPRAVQIRMLLPRELGIARRWASSFGNYARELKKQGHQSESPNLANYKKSDLLDVKSKDMLIPGLIVAFPFWKIPWNQQFFYHKTRLSLWAAHYANRLSIIWSSKIKFWGKPQLRLERRSGIREAALNLQTELNIAMAEGDLPALRRLCSNTLYSSFSGTISRRRVTDKYCWTLEQIHRSPVLGAIRLLQMPNDNRQYRHMAVVSIESTQSLVKIDPRTSEPIEGTKKTQRKVENMLMYRTIDMKTYEQGPWYAYGFLPTSTPEDVVTMKKHMDALSIESASRYRQKNQIVLEEESGVFAPRKKN